MMADRNNWHLKQDSNFSKPMDYLELYCIIEQWFPENADQKKDLGPVKNSRKYLEEHTTAAGITQRLVSESGVHKTGDIVWYRIFIEREGIFPKLPVEDKESTIQPVTAPSGVAEEQGDDIDHGAEEAGDNDDDDNLVGLEEFETNVSGMDEDGPDLGDDESEAE